MMTEPKTIEQRAEELVDAIDGVTVEDMRDMILAALRSVERDTRDACAKACAVEKAKVNPDAESADFTFREACAHNNACDNIEAAIRSQGDTPDKAANSKTGSEDR